jgi:hypothetical protein
MLHREKSGNPALHYKRIFFVSSLAGSADVNVISYFFKRVF